MKYLAIIIVFMLFLISGCRSSEQQDSTFELKYGLYDDFDGNGCLQTYNNQQLAEAGALNSKLWRGQGQVVNSPGINQDQLMQIYRVVNEKDKSLSTLNLPSTVIRWLGAGDLVYFDERIDGIVQINKNHEYGRLDLVNCPLNDSHGKVAQVNYIPGDRGAIVTELIYPEKISFQDYQSWMADVMITLHPTLDTSSDIFFAGLNFSGSLILQGGGYWESTIHLTFHRGAVSVDCRIDNKNTGYSISHETPGELSRWYNLKMDIVTLSDTQFRVHYFVDGNLMWAISPPESDCTILMDPKYAGYGPIRGLALGFNSDGGQGFGYFDNVYAVYTDRVQ
jgi:hypothetical protein